MRIIKTRLDDAGFAKLSKMRKTAGLPSISALFLEKCGLLSDEKEAQEIVRLALIRAKKKPRGTEFRLRDLFVKSLWEEFSKGARLRSGKMFYDRVSAAVHGIRDCGKSPSNHQLYIRA